MGFGKAPVWLWPFALPIAVRGFYNGLRLANPPRKPLAPDARTQASASLANLEDFEVTTSDGIAISGWYVPPRDGRVVILGVGGFTNRTQLIHEASLLTRRGLGIVLFDWRGTGGSGGERSDWGRREQLDLTAVIDFLAARPEVRRIGAFGFSIAGNVVAMVGARDSRLAAVALHGAWTTNDEEFAYKGAKYGVLTAVPGVWAFRLRGLDLSGVRPIDVIGRISPRPLLIVTADQDFHTPLEMTRRLLAAAGEPKRLWVGVGNQHIPYPDDGSVSALRVQIGQQLVDFFDGALREEQTAEPRRYG